MKKAFLLIIISTVVMATCVKADESDSTIQRKKMATGPFFTEGGCTGNGSISFQRWDNIEGITVASLTSLPDFPSNPTVTGTLTRLEVPTDIGDAYGIRVLGYLCAPQTGYYTFWIYGNDQVALWLSTDANQANKQKIAHHNGFTIRRQWNKYASQKSAPVFLSAGSLYYIEAIMKEGTGSDLMAVGWAKPGQATSAPSEIIQGANLVADQVPPTLPGTPEATEITTNAFKITWTASVENMELSGYDILLNGVKINQPPVLDTFFTINGLTEGTTYSVSIIAKDAAGNNSAATPAISVSTLSVTAPPEHFTQRTVIANQPMPWDIAWGPDNQIWYTERTTGRVSKVNPATGTKKVLLSLGANMVQSTGQDGLLGMAIHPQFNTGKPFVYIAFTYSELSVTERLTCIKRYVYNFGNQKLEAPVTVLENIPGSNDHNSGRMAIGPDLKLYYTVGDMGSGQYLSVNRPNNAQNLQVLEGKILRLNLELTNNSWIPEDNPFTDSLGNKTAVYTYGHRNAQGLVWGNVNGIYKLYSSEHGPFTDDEINLVEAGGNYGWPNVIGFCDGNYNGRTTGNFFMENEQLNCGALNVKEPLKSMFPYANPPQGQTNQATWPTLAPSGMDYYGSDAIPGWKNSLLIATLKNGSILRYKLSSDGNAIVGDTLHYFRGSGRFRDVIVSPDGFKIYVSCDTRGNTSGPTGGVLAVPPNPGSILEFTYTPESSGADPMFITGQYPVKAFSNQGIKQKSGTNPMVLPYNRLEGRDK